MGYTKIYCWWCIQNTDLAVSDGSTGATLSHRMIEFTGTITGNQVVTIPLDVQTTLFYKNSTSGAYTVVFKYITGYWEFYFFCYGCKQKYFLHTGNPRYNKSKILNIISK